MKRKEDCKKWLMCYYAVLLIEMVKKAEAKTKMIKVEPKRWSEMCKVMQTLGKCGINNLELLKN